MGEVKLSPRQKEIFSFIRKHLNKNGYPPSVREIGEAVGISSPGTIHRHLAKMEEVGVLRRGEGKSRSIELLNGKVKKLIYGNGLPLVGQVPAGLPILAEENIEEYMDLMELIKANDGEFILQVQGESMIDAGIMPGDYVVVKIQNSADNGDIVIAMIDSEPEATLKRFYKENSHIRLQPENKAMQPIISKEVHILGKVVGVFRSVA